MSRSTEFGLASGLVLAVLIAGCASDPVPKPHGYLRIDLPEQSFKIWKDEGVFSAELPEYSNIRETRRSPSARWYNLSFPGQRATVHLTWGPVNGQLQEMIEDAHTFKDKHGAVATRIRSSRVLRDSSRVYGTLFEVDGDAASPMVFYLTDSTDNFLYGALYFNSRPNGDSLAPVTERIRADMKHMAETLEWSK